MLLGGHNLILQTPVSFCGLIIEKIQKQAFIYEITCNGGVIFSYSAFKTNRTFLSFSELASTFSVPTSCFKECMMLIASIPSSWKVCNNQCWVPQVYI